MNQGVMRQGLSWAAARRPTTTAMAVCAAHACLVLALVTNADSTAPGAQAVAQQAVLSVSVGAVQPRRPDAPSDTPSDARPAARLTNPQLAQPSPSSEAPPAASMRDDPKPEGTSIAAPAADISGRESSNQSLSSVMHAASTTSVTPITPITRNASADHSHCPPAPHPAALRERGIEGAVLLRVRVDAQGRAADVQVVAASGWRLFDEAALQRVRGCRFVPALRAGEAVDSWVEFPVRFVLAG